MTLSTGPWWWAPVFAFGWMTTVPAQSFSAPVRAWVMAAARFMLDINTAQTPGMNRAAAITHARTGAEKLWAGTVVIHPKAKTGAHHHGPVESVIYVVSGKARMRWG